MTQIDTKINSISRLKIVKSLPHAGLLWIIARIPESFANKRVRKILLFHIITLEIMGIFITLMIPEFLHKGSRRIPQM